MNSSADVYATTVTRQRGPFREVFHYSVLADCQAVAYAKGLSRFLNEPDGPAYSAGATVSAVVANHVFCAERDCFRPAVTNV